MARRTCAGPCRRVARCTVFLHPPAVPPDVARFAKVSQYKLLAKLRRRALGLLGAHQAPVIPLTLDERELREQRHVFVFAVNGRSSSTALVRILNSSHDICVWGEPGEYIIDDSMELIARLTKKNERPAFQERKKLIHQAYAERNHTIGHAMAFPELAPAISKLVAGFAAMFTPAIDVKRFGFKELKIRSDETLKTLRSLFPNAEFIFLFRDPATQWPSVKNMKWKRVDTLDKFLQQNAWLAELYEAHGGMFIENTSLRDKEKVRKFVKWLGLSEIDESLIGDGVFAMKNKDPLTEEEVAKIEASDANAAYKRMRALEDEFFAAH